MDPNTGGVRSAYPQAASHSGHNTVSLAHRRGPAAMTLHIRHCTDCGSTSAETLFPPRKPHGQPQRCTDCVVEAERKPPEAARIPVQTRRSYRAGYRHRAKMAQLDLVDLIVGCP